MPACARKDIVRPGVPGIFHGWSRCVRRAFLMGTDRYTGKDDNHRRLWVLERLELLAANFAIDVAFRGAIWRWSDLSSIFALGGGVYDDTERL